MKKIAVIGSTGSIGTQVLSVVKKNPDKFKVVALSAGENSNLFIKQIDEFKPKIATLSKKVTNDYIPPKETTLISGEENAFISAITKDADLVVVALVGFKGLEAVIKAIELKKDVALANKESLVVGGALVMQKAKENGVTITPIDSEHSAIWQALNFDFNTPFKRLILTASGGAFRDFNLKQLKTVKGKDALNHPTWNMGAKITVDSATLVNKGYEVIEAHWLYNADFDKIDVIIHRESVIHSMVEFCDSSVIAQMSYPNMELPIQIAMSYPERFSSGLKSINFAELKELTFSNIDEKRFPCFKLVIDVGKRGKVYPAVLNGANERAVKGFLSNEISYFDIYKILSGAVNAYNGKTEVTLDNLKFADKFGTEFAERYIKNNV